MKRAGEKHLKEGVTCSAVISNTAFDGPYQLAQLGLAQLPLSKEATKQLSYSGTESHPGTKQNST